MSKRPVDVHSVADAVERISEPIEGDKMIVRTMPLTVPTEAYDAAVVNAAMGLLLNEFYANPSAAAKLGTGMCDAGEYEIVLVCHIRRVGVHEEGTLLN